MAAAGKNLNFNPGFTVPAAMTLDGYAVGDTGAAKVYRSVDVRRTIAKAKIAGVITAATALGAKIAVLYGSWPLDAGNAKGFRVYLTHPARGGSPPWTAANVTALLADIETAAT